MSLKSRYISLAVLLHLMLGLMIYTLKPNMGASFLFVEAMLLISLALFIGLIQALYKPVEYIDMFRQTLMEAEFTTRFSQTGNKELDNLMSLFNKMLSQLYDERIKLGDRQGMLQQLLNATPIATVIFDYNNGISSVNPAACKLFGISEQEAKGKSFAAIAHPLIPAIVNLRNGESKLVTDKYGKRYRCQINVFVDRGFDRKFLQIQELTQELQTSEKQTYEKLIRVMNHEVNNTMAATSSLLHTCLDYSADFGGESADDFKSALSIVIDRIKHLNEFMQSYAKVIRLPDLQKESCDLVQLVAGCLRLFQGKFNEFNIEYSISYDPDDSFIVELDQNLCEQVVINIIKNGIESIDGPGKIDVAVVKDAGLVVLKIKDTGHGIESSKQQFLFSPFYTTKAEGQGIGLMFIREVLELHGFAFALYNNESQGACFEIVFKGTD